MARWLLSFNLAILVAVSSFAAGAGPQVTYSDQKISINVDGITLGRLIQLWDQATGLRSHVPPELQDQKVNVHFSGLTVNDAVRAIFRQVPVDYLFIEAQGIVVTAPQSSPPEPAPVYANAPEITNQQPVEKLADQPLMPLMPPPREKPLIPTPFGPIPDSGHPMVQLPPVPGEVFPTPFFAPAPSWPAPATSAPIQNNRTGPMPIYQNPSTLIWER